MVVNEPTLHAESNMHMVDSHGHNLYIVRIRTSLAKTIIIGWRVYETDCQFFSANVPPDSSG
jgi:hypothetical protein